VPKFQDDPVLSANATDGEPAVSGEGAVGHGVRGISHSVAAAVVGLNDAPGEGGNGAWFESSQGEGVRGWAKGGHAGVVDGMGDKGSGVVGESNTGAGIFGRGPTGGRFEGGANPAVDAVSLAGGLAGRFTGNVVVTGDIELPGADLAEQFGVVGEMAAEPGSVVVLAGDDRVRVSDEAYDRRVAGVISGAGSYRAALILDKQAGEERRPVALSGKVWCKVEADSAPVGLGDLLTTSATPGHAMCAADPTRAFGAVIGQALGSLKSGRGLLPVLVALR
jgi:hypothetical protein